MPPSDYQDRQARRERLGMALSGPRPTALLTVDRCTELFTTPPELAARLVALADPPAAAEILEPSAGTGNLLRAIAAHGRATRVCAVELNGKLAGLLAQAGAQTQLVQGDFLAQTPDRLGRFHTVIMNPPFANAADIRHIRHAMQFLYPGGRLAGICAAGPRQHAQLRPQILQAGGTWELLPCGTFESAGTHARTVLLSWSKMD